MDWKQQLENTNLAMGDFGQAQPATSEGFNALHHAAVTPGSLTAKDKELIALAIGISKQCIDCIGFHVQASIAAGATRDDIAETVNVCILMGGGPAYMYGVKALQAYDQLCA
ncbi:carboxymuconolactone decarboxylase family protein [Actibacterium sp. D379-3]